MRKKNTQAKKSKKNPVRKIKKILIANRGEIVLRIARTCKEMGIATIGVHTSDDKNPLIEKNCDQYHPLGGKGVSTYLDIAKIIKAAKKNKADAIHPGYGFLSENADFARACEKNSIIFIGPPSQVLRKVSDKIESKKTAEEHGIPTLPSVGPIKHSKELDLFIKKNGYPIILKSTLGGGGRGMRIIKEKKQITERIPSAKQEVARCFGYTSMFAEKYVKGRHIEFQFLTDKQGKTVTLFERECSIQRRFQKIIEEAPAPTLTQATREKISRQVCNLASSIGYEGAGTVEFLMTPKGKYYFIELNPRIQVEHGITELITGVDIIKEQIKIAEGIKINKRLNNVKKKGHAIQCRIVAENARKDFSPGYGTISRLEFPAIDAHSRIDSAIYEGMKIKYHYDSLLAKIMVRGHNRTAAIRKMKKALQATKIQGIDNTLTFQEFLIRHPKFEKAQLSTSFLKDNKITEKYADDNLKDKTVAKIVAAIFEVEKENKVKHENRWKESGWTRNGWKD